MLASGPNQWAAEVAWAEFLGLPSYLSVCVNRSTVVVCLLVEALLANRLQQPPMASPSIQLPLTAFELELRPDQLSTLTEQVYSNSEPNWSV